MLLRHAVLLLQRTLIDLLGPIIDPIGYQLELETYVAKVLRGPANLYISAIGFLVSAAMFFHFFVDPHKALMVRIIALPHASTAIGRLHLCTWLWYSLVLGQVTLRRWTNCVLLAP